jgi:putative heme iron utilization protein
MSNASEARCLLREHQYGALSTISKKLAGFPFGSITPYLTDHDGNLLIYISELAEHTKNIAHDPRVSLITHNQSSPEIQMQGRVTVTGNAHRLADQQQPAARYLHHFPEAAELMMLDFAFYRIKPVAIRYIGGVGRIHWINMESYVVNNTAEFAEQEETLLSKINTQQQSTVCRLLKQCHGIETNNTRAIGLDCDGLTIIASEQVLRLNFASTVSDPLLFEQLDRLPLAKPSDSL